MQTIIIGLLLLTSIIYLGRLLYRSFTSTSCVSGCGKCGAIDAEKMINEIKDKRVFLNA